jgi:ABC-2 type transport system permease protein
MNALWRVFRYELIRHARRRSYLLVTLGVPLAAIVLYYGILAYNSVQKSTPGNTVSVAPPPGFNLPSGSIKLGDIGLVDQSGIIKADTDVKPLIRYPDQDSANAAVKSGKIVSYYVLPADYLKTGRYELWMSSISVSGGSGTLVRQVVTRAITDQMALSDPDIVRRLTQTPPDIVNHRLTDSNQLKESAGGDLSFALVYGFALAFTFGVFLSSGLLMASVVEEKENRVVEILLSSVRPGQLLGGKVLALGLLGLTQILAWGAAAVFILGRLAATLPGGAALAITPSQFAILIAYYILGYLMFASVYAGIGALSNSMREGPQIAAFFTIPAMIPLYLTVNFASQPDGPLPVILSLFPITAPMAMIMRVAVSPVPVWQLAVSLVLLALTGIVFIWIAGRIFRLVIMLSGQMPKLRDLPKLLRMVN